MWHNYRTGARWLIDWPRWSCAVIHPAGEYHRGASEISEQDSTEMTPLPIIYPERSARARLSWRNVREKSRGASWRRSPERGYLGGASKITAIAMTSFEGSFDGWWFEEIGEQSEDGWSDGHLALSRWSRRS
ncbi:hypothetical protein PTI98_008347 [Pleurotus ostreatus]|nr:hypothetical protein PTI98_008347 [Pleurotus ostreatus]